MKNTPSVPDSEFLLDTPQPQSVTTALGQTFNLLKVLRYVGYRVEAAGRKRFYVETQCQCGTLKVIGVDNVRSGAVKSCGCVGRAKLLARCTKHNHAHRKNDTRTFHTWCGIIQRCKWSPKSRYFANYAGRGIKVCDRWQDFSAFLADMGECPSPDHSIDRINNDGDYQPSNCRWATYYEQSNNRRNNRQVTVHGVLMNIAEAERAMGYKRGLILNRLAKGWSEEKAVYTPIGPSGRRNRH